MIIRRRLGYTLIEVILASAIATVMLVALFSALRMHLVTAEWGPREAMRLHRSRAISEQMRSDLDSLVIPGQIEKITAIYDQESEMFQRVTEYSGLTGQTKWIEFYSDHPSIDIDRHSTTPVGISRIRYEFVRSLPADSGAGGKTGWALRRTQVPAEFGNAADDGRSDAAKWTRIDVVSDEITWMNFHFWDASSGTWVDSWLPQSGSAMPEAVAISLRFDPSSRDEGRERWSEDSICRFVYALRP